MARWRGWCAPRSKVGWTWLVLVGGTNANKRAWQSIVGWCEWSGVWRTSHQRPTLALHWSLDPTRATTFLARFAPPLPLLLPSSLISLFLAFPSCTNDCPIATFSIIWVSTLFILSCNRLPKALMKFMGFESRAHPSLVSKLASSMVANL